MAPQVKKPALPPLWLWVPAMAWFQRLAQKRLQPRAWAKRKKKKRERQCQRWVFSVHIVVIGLSALSPAARVQSLVWELRGHHAAACHSKKSTEINTKKKEGAILKDGLPPIHHVNMDPVIRITGCAVRAEL